MKRVYILTLCAVCGFAAVAADWTYDGTYVSDGVWKFKATASGTEITFGRMQTDLVPSEVTPLDFSKPVTDGDGTTYTIVSLDECLGRCNGSKSPTREEIAEQYRNLIGKLTLPSTGLRHIGSRAFGKAANMTGPIAIPSSVTWIEREAFIDDAKLVVDGDNSCQGVTRIDAQAFQGVQITGTLHLNAITSISDQPANVDNVFMNSSLGSVVFGPGLTKMVGIARNGFLANCPSLTNITFDASSSVAMTIGGIFYNNPKLTTIDLSCVTSMTEKEEREGYSHFQKSGIKTVVFSSKLANLGSHAFSLATDLSEVHFYGAPPATLVTPVLAEAAAGKVLTTCVHLDKNAADYASAKSAWDALTAGGELLETGSTWSQAMAGSVYASRPLLLYTEEEKGKLGHWIYDDRGATPVVSNGVWCFNATPSGKSIAVGACTAWPTEVTELDFTKSVTDYEGHARNFSEISPAFSTSASSAKAAAAYVGRVSLPDVGLLAIGAWAFANCVNCTEVSNAIPDSVAALGEGAFYKVPFSAGKGKVRLYGISTVADNTFANSTCLEDVTFGPGLKSIGGGKSNGAFINCTALTNIVFDAAMTGATVGGNGQDAGFYMCSNLKGDLDLSGFSEFSAPLFQNTAVTSLTFGTNLTEIARHSFRAMSSLTNVTFNGAAPTFWSNECRYMQDISDGQKVTTCIHKAYRRKLNSAGKCWLDYAEDGKLVQEGTTWARSYLFSSSVPLANRPLVTIEPIKGFMIIVR